MKKKIITGAFRIRTVRKGPFEFVRVPGGYSLIRFAGCGDERDVVLPRHVLYEPIIEIADEVFAGLNVQRVLIPFSIAKIGKRCFAGCHLKLITTDLFEQTSIWDEPMSMLPSGVTNLGEEAFVGAGIERMMILATNAHIADRCFARSRLQELHYCHEVSLGADVFDFETETVEYTERWFILKKKTEG